MRPRHGRDVAAALLLDALAGEPPEFLHPTVWMGRAISAFEARALASKSPGARRLAGAVLALSLPVVIFLSARAMLYVTPRPLRGMLEVALISASLSMRGLARAGVAVERDLYDGEIEDARASVGRFVGRDTAELSAPEVARAAVESVAENTSDGVLAPMLYGLALGAPGALAYRAVNTLDSMVGHKEDPYADLGWASARLDDLANLVPARATVLAVAAVSGRPFAVIRSARRYGPLTESPNAGRVEAAFAAALGVRLGGANSYGGTRREGPVLGEGPLPEPGDIRRGVRLMRGAIALLAGLALFAGTKSRG